MAFEKFDAAAGYTFGFEWDGTLFQEVVEATLPKNEVDKIDIKHTTFDGKQIHKVIPGWTKPPEVTIKLYVTEGIKKLYDEFKLASEGKMPSVRKGGSIMIKDLEKGDVLRFNMTNAWIQSIDYGSVKSADTGGLIATIKFVTEGWEMA